MICDDVERDLDPYVDRELDPDSAAAVRDHLTTCVACRQRVADRQALGRLVRTVPYYQAPDRLRARAPAQLKRPAVSQRITVWAAAAVLIVSVAAGISLLRPTTAPADAIADEVVRSHVRSLMADHLFDIRSTDQHTVKPWFLGKLDFSPPVVDLASIGFPLVGGRLDYVAGRPVAALVYQRHQHAINVFIWPVGDGASTTAVQSVRGFHAHHWVRGGMSFWAVSDVNEAELAEFARALRESSFANAVHNSPGRAEKTGALASRQVTVPRTERARERPSRALVHAAPHVASIHPLRRPGWPVRL